MAIRPKREAVANRSHVGKGEVVEGAVVDYYEKLFKRKSGVEAYYGGFRVQSNRTGGEWLERAIEEKEGKRVAEC
ncbi:hypothetical protein KY290_000222 [Solanum tuberosum]|uniref:Uncharacterized protein n=1 Tax=Solanum tuberosum TaxID=4113 RepID=A0ABQ7WIR9_SOLTU|nr:hypothetical protein KY284_000239 [Solanum tuberosum]KAH0729042.1 hypothetical protein KY289_000230 [Solanum tuberosum]KAH0764344.1 hypothetical protein KY285_000215 [Solanum tuberosum]KAH0780624.1 hypothetical protein KY290_000222 [Solanum tuberosum]